jgi:hypothetical protein
MQVYLNVPSRIFPQGEILNAFFIGDEGRIAIPYDGDFLAEFAPHEFSIVDLPTRLEYAYNIKRFNSACNIYNRMLAYCKANNIKLQSN